MASRRSLSYVRGSMAVMVVVVMLLIVMGSFPIFITAQVDHARVKKIIQIGTPRSASTVQFFTLCAIAVIKYGATRVTCSYDDHLDYDADDQRVHVIKTHHEGHLFEALQSLKKGEGVVFHSMISRSTDVTEIDLAGTIRAKVVRSEWLALDVEKQAQLKKQLLVSLSWLAAANTNAVNIMREIDLPDLKSLNAVDAGLGDRLSSAVFTNFPYNITFTQHISDLKKHGSNLAHAYKAIFGLSNEQISMVVQYLHLWTPIRVCCGIQLSKYKRAWLQDESAHGDWGVEQSVCQGGNNSFEATFLESTRLLQVIRTELNTQLHQQQQHPQQHTDDAYTLNTTGCLWPSDIGVLIKPSLLDPGYLNGSYCDSYDADVVINKHKFNQPRKTHPWYDSAVEWRLSCPLCKR
eukprot:m.223576 g.223576  ORF g.223576 m.223576 type:complete len:406 (-) comp33406_c0_seq1:219-1436(-)